MDTPFAFETIQGALAGLIFGLGTLLVIIIPRYKYTVASILVVLITPLALLPFFFSYEALGISDWDYYFSMHTNVRNTILQYHQFPLWNPYTCGGTAALGDPEFPGLSPLFLLELVFGTPIGLRLSIYASTIIGALGMLHLSRILGIGAVGGLIASLGMSFGTVNLLEIVEGHQNILAAMYIPWVLFCWYRAYTRERRLVWILLTSLLLALMLFQGGIYLLMYMTGSFIFLIMAVKRKRDALHITVISGVVAIGLSSVKLIPVLLWLTQFQDMSYASSAFTLPYLHKILMGRILYGATDIIPNQGSGWHEYGAYIGPVVLGLAIVGGIIGRKRRAVQALVIGSIIALIISSLGPTLKPIFDHLSFIPRSNISRLILFAIIPLSLLAGFGVESIGRHSKRAAYYVCILVTLAAIDIMSLSYPLSSQAFVLPHVAHSIPEAPSPIGYGPYDYKIRHEGNDYTRAYDATLKGYGNMTYCSVLGPDPAVRLITDEGGASILSFPDDTSASFTTTSWSPNRVVFQVTTSKPTSAILNANYAKGWNANGAAAKEIGNRIGIDIPKGTSTLVFSYIPPGIHLGIGIMAFTILCTFALLFRK